MDGAGRLTRSVKSWLGKPAEAIALYRASRAAQRRARNGQFQIRRGIGTSFALLFLAGSGIAGFFIGGHDAAFRREYGTIPDALASAFGAAAPATAAANAPRMKSRRPRLPSANTVRTPFASRKLSGARRRRPRSALAGAA